MNRTQMLDLLDKGCTPEYVSLLKWLELRRQVMMGELIGRDNIGANTCAMCKEYRPLWYNCSNCTMIEYFDTCEAPSSIWHKISNHRFDKKPVPLHLITQMVNQLQFLVAVYGKRNKP